MINSLTYTLSFKLPLCWLHLCTPVTYLCKLLGCAVLPPQRSVNDFVYSKGKGNFDRRVNAVDSGPRQDK
ncbi:hypothetical protein SAMN05192562_103283 [Kosakonia arachidis]|uniref:Uncharacterized protein n=1 Tax=Kosakonia arachidis TaxID=551989 RepID=A0A1I7C6D5_9ENTR|nr:hypothetical protein SAMN05192562_103283 [Kosakonia arachidis]